jgi:hypothetical protein
MSLRSPAIFLPVNYLIILPHPRVQPYLLIYTHTRPYTDIRPYTCGRLTSVCFSPQVGNSVLHNGVGVELESVGTGFGPMAFVAYGGLQPPTAPIGLACPHAEE